MSKIRTFIAVDPPAKMRARAGLLIEKLAQTDARVKWIEPENLHWTLKFLGEVENRHIAKICEVVSAAAAKIPPFEATAFGAGAFPTSSRPRTVWLGIQAGSEPFIALHDAVEEALAPLGFRREHRRFRPHMTLGRVRRSPHGIDQLAAQIAEFAEFDAGSMQVSQLILFSSLLDRHGPAYQVLGRADLLG